MRTRPGLSFYASMFVIIIVTMVMHEVVHWLVGAALGYEMYFKLTQAGLVEGAWRSERDYALVSIAGPVFTATMGVAGAWLAITRRMALGYELIFVAFMQRFLALVMSALFIPNDEARVSLYLGLEWWVVPLCFVLPLLALTIWSSRVLKFGVLVNFFCYLTASVAFTLMVYGDGQMIGSRGPSILDPLLPEPARYQAEPQAANAARRWRCVRLAGLSPARAAI